MSACESTDELPPRQRGDGSRVIWQVPGLERQDDSQSPFETISPGEEKLVDIESGFNNVRDAK